MVELWIIILRPEKEWVDLHRLGIVHFLPVRVGVSHAGLLWFEHGGEKEPIVY